MRHPGHLPPNTATMANPAKPSNLRHLPPRTLPKPSNITALRPRPDDLDLPPLLHATDARQERLDTLGYLALVTVAYAIIALGLALGWAWLWQQHGPAITQLLWALAARVG